MAPLNWPGIPDIRHELTRKWEKGLYYKILLQEGRESGFPLKVKLKKPGSGQILDNFEETVRWVERCRADAAASRVVLEWQSINHKQYGRNQLPDFIRFEDMDSLAAFLRREKELALFERLSRLILSAYPDLHSWLIHYPLEILKLEQQTVRLLSCVEWIRNHPRPGIYLRQLSLPGIDTKFLESYKRVLTQWLDALLPPSQINDEFSGVKQFERRFGFKTRCDTVRFRILDKDCTIAGLSDLTIPASDFARLSPRGITKIIVLENDITALSLPGFKGTMALFGRGYSFENIMNAHWMDDLEIWYWGDIDSHGYAILSQFRSHFPTGKSILMDEQTLLMNREHWTQEQMPRQADLPGLTEKEWETYKSLIKNKWGPSLRLEQEFIPYDQVIETLAAAGLKEMSREE